MQEHQIFKGGEEFSFGSGPTGALLVHGFTGSPWSMRGLGEYLGQNGLSVKGIRLPGHGTHWEDLATKSPKDWTAAVDAAFEEFVADHDQVFLVGLSFGVALILDFAARHPKRVDGIVGMAGFLTRKDPLDVLAPLAPVLGRVLRSVPGVGNDICLEGQDELCYDRVPLLAASRMKRFGLQVRDNLGKVTAPILLMHSRNDHTAPPENSQVIHDGVSSTDKELVWFDRSYHILTMDHDKDDVFKRTLEFINSHAKAKV